MLLQTLKMFRDLNSKLRIEKHFRTLFELNDNIYGLYVALRLRSRQKIQSTVQSKVSTFLSRDLT